MRNQSEAAELQRSLNDTTAAKTSSIPAGAAFTLRGALLGLPSLVPPSRPFISGASTRIYQSALSSRWWCDPSSEHRSAFVFVIFPNFSRFSVGCLDCGCVLHCLMLAAPYPYTIYCSTFIHLPWFNSSSAKPELTRNQVPCGSLLKIAISRDITGKSATMPASSRSCLATTGLMLTPQQMHTIHYRSPLRPPN